MNKNRDLFVISLVIMIFVTSSGIFLNGLLQRNTSLNGIQKTYPKSSGPHSKIYIDGNNALNAYCAGNGTDGTFSNPHIFKDYEIDAGGSDSGIEIRNTDLYLIIQNCSIINSGDFKAAPDGGIELYNCKNINITDCQINNNYYGVYLENSENNTLSENNVRDNIGHGIYLNNSMSNFLLSNNASYNEDHGIFLCSSDNNTLFDNLMVDDGIYISDSKNTLLDTTNFVDGRPIYYYEKLIGLNIDGLVGAGQLILVNCNNSVIVNTDISYTTIGFLFSYCYGNMISGNIASHNNLVGIRLDHSQNNTLMGNNLLYNDLYGIRLSNSKNNSLSNNIMMEDGLYVENSILNIIDTTNNVNGKPIYYYENEREKDFNGFTNAGQLILVNCNDSNINNWNISSVTLGITLSYCKNNTVTKNNVTECNRYGILLEKSNENTLSDNTASKDNLYGIHLNYSHNNTISKNDATYNDYHGIVLYYSENNSLTGNDASHNYYYGIFLYMQSNNNLLFNNTMDNTFIFFDQRWGLALYASDDNTILNNTISNNYYGMVIWSTKSNIISNNTVKDNGVGVCDQFSSDNIFLNNDISSSIWYGFWLYETERDILSNNFALNNGHHGIYLESSDNNTLLNNTASHSTFYDGIYLESSHHNVLSGNSLKDNGNHGTRLANSDNNTLSYNKAFDNGDNGIYLTGSDSNTINQNDAIHNNYNNIYLAFSDSNILTENNASLSIFDYGFNLWNSCYNTLSNNFATRNNGHGIYLLGAHNSKLTRNTASFNPQQGIALFSSDNSILKENVAYNNTQNGFYLENSDNTTLLGNDIHNNFQNGIYFFFSNNGTISDNDINENQQDGLNLYQSDNNTISGNTISDNVNRGIFLDDVVSGSDYNTFYKNFFINNGIHAIDETSNNDWNNTDIGNYWDNYTGVDDNNDGIGDSPHNFNGGTDFLPIVDDQAPTITIQSPIGDEIFGINAPDFVIEIIELYLDTMWYTIDGGITNITFTENGTISQSAWDDFPDGDVVIRFYANDSVGNIGFSEVTIRKDVDAPIITINNPQNNDVIGATAPNFDIFIDELNLDKTWYSLNGGTNKFFTGLTGTINQTLWDALPEGNVVIKFYANDTLERISSQEVTVKKDVTAPIITINNPQNNDLIGATAPNFNISIDEPNLDRVWYSLNGGTNMFFTGLTGTINQTLWDGLPEGNVIIKFYASDTLGRISSQEVTVKKDVTAPIITINNPQNNDLVEATAPNFNISIDEPNLDTMWYSLNGGTNMTFTGLTGTIDQALWVALWDTLSDGDLITIRFYANDTFGHLTYKEVIVVKNDPPQSAPGGIPGYDLFLFLSVLFISIGIISIVAIKKWVNI